MMAPRTVPEAPAAIQVEHEGVAVPRGKDVRHHVRGPPRGHARGPLPALAHHCGNKCVRECVRLGC